MNTDWFQSLPVYLLCPKVWAGNQKKCAYYVAKLLSWKIDSKCSDSWQTFKLQDFRLFCSVFEVSDFLVCCKESMGRLLLTVWDSRLVPFSGLKMPKKNAGRCL